MRPEKLNVRTLNPIKNTRVDKSYPAFVPNMLMDGEGNCWLQQFTPSGFEGFLYDVFDPEGIFIQQAVLPSYITMFKNGKAYSLIRADVEYPPVKRYRLDKR